MENETNRRTKITKMLLEQSLIELMKTKSIHHITVKELCEKADINRSTFYKHYESVYDLYSDILKTVKNDFLEMIQNARANNMMFNHRLYEQGLLYVESRKELFLVLLSDKSNIGIGESLINMTDMFLDKENTNQFSRYCSQFVSAGLTSIVWMWLNDENAHSAHEVAVLLQTLLDHGMKRALNFTKQQMSAE